MSNTFSILWKVVRLQNTTLWPKFPAPRPAPCWPARTCWTRQASWTPSPRLPFRQNKCKQLPWLIQGSCFLPVNIFFVMDISFGRAERPQLYLPVGKHVSARSFPHPCLSSDQSQPTLQRSQSGGPQPDGGY